MRKVMRPPSAPSLPSPEAVPRRIAPPPAPKLEEATAPLGISLSVPEIEAALRPDRPFAERHRAMQAAIDQSLIELVAQNLGQFEGDRDTKYHAAKILGARGLPVLLELAFDDRDASAELRAKALRAALGAELDRAELCERALATGVDALIAIAVRELRALGRAPKPLELRELAQNGSEQTALEVAIALRDATGAAAELTLLELLERPELSVRQEAIASLTIIGTHRSVEALESLIAKSNDLALRELRDHLRKQVSPGPGTLSLVPDTGEGALSFAEDSAGRLSEAEKKSPTND